MNNRFTISLYTIFEVLIYLLTFLEIRNNSVKYGLIIIIGLFLISKVTYGILDKNRCLNRLLGIFAVVSSFISFCSIGMTSRNPFLANVVFVCILIEFVLFVEVISAKKGIQHFLRTANICEIAICIITDILVFTKGGNSGLYLVGTKFQVVYHHILAIALYMFVNMNRIKNRKSIKYYKSFFNLILLLSLTILVSIKVDCSTGIVGLIAFFIFVGLINIKKRFFTRPIVFIGAIVLSFCFMWGFESILSNKHIIILITVYLERSLSLTGRTIIYSKMLNVMKNHWLLGFGYGSTYEICLSQIGFADTQNALMEWIMQLGIIGTICLLIVLVFAFSQLKNLRNCRQWIWLVAYIYTLIFIGTVEITYTMYFFGVIVLIYILGNEKKGSD